MFALVPISQLILFVQKIYIIKFVKVNMGLMDWIKKDYGRNALCSIVIAIIISILIYILFYILNLYHTFSLKYILIPGILYFILSAIPYIFLISSIVFLILSFKKQGFNKKALITLLILIPIILFYIFMWIFAIGGGPQ